MTPEEAKKKFCPVRNTLEPEQVDEMKVAYDIASCTCMGKDCMCWRWNDEPPTVDKYGYETEQHTDGYCGLAGKE